MPDDILQSLMSNPTVQQPRQEDDPLKSLESNPTAGNLGAFIEKQAVDSARDNPDKEPNFEAIKPALQQHFPETDPESLRAPFEQTHQLAAHREKAKEGEESWRGFVQRHSIPFASDIQQRELQKNYEAAIARFNAGKPTDEDYKDIAAFERLQEIDKNRGLAGQVGTALAGIPAIAGEAYVGGKALGTIAKAVPALGALAPEAAGAGAFGARTLATTALMPSMYLSGARQRAQESGGQETDLRNLAPAFALGALNTAVLGSLGKTAGGIQSPMLRLLARTGTGVAEQQAADVIAGASGLDSSYGLLGDLARGDPKSALQRATVQAFTFAAFTALHGNKPEEVTGAYSSFLEAAKERGLSAKGAGELGEKVFKNLSEALDANPTMSPTEARQLVAGWKDKLQQQLGRALVDTLPEPSSGPPAPEPGTGIINPVPSGVPGIVSGAVELPEAPKGPFEGLGGDEISQVAEQLTGKKLRTAAGLVAELKRRGLNEAGISQLAEAFKPQPAPPEAPGSRLSPEEAEPAQMTTEEVNRAPATPEWAESPAVAQPTLAAEDFSPGGKHYQPSTAPEAPLSRLDRLRKAQEGVTGAPVAPPQRPLPERVPTIAEATPPSQRLLEKAAEQAKQGRAEREGKKEIPPGADEPQQAAGESKEAWKDRVLNDRVEKFRAVVNDAIDSPSVDKLDHVAEVVSRLASMAEGRGLDPHELITRELPELKAFGEDTVKELINWGLEHRNERLNSAELAQRNGFEPASFRRGIQQRLQDALTRPENPPAPQGAETAGTEPAAGSTEGTSTPAGVEATPAGGGPTLGRKLTKAQQRAAALAEKKANRRGEHETFGLSEKEWDDLTPLQQQQFRVTKSDFLIEEKRLKVKGEQSAYQEALSEGGISRESFGKAKKAGRRSEELKGWLENKMPPQLIAERGRGIGLDELADQWQSRGYIDANLGPSAAMEAVLEKIMQHGLIEEGSKIDAEHKQAWEEYLNAKADAIRQEVHDANPGYTTEQVEAEVSRRMDAAPSSNEAEASPRTAQEENAAVPGQAQDSSFDFGANAAEFGRPLSEAEKAQGRIGGGQANATGQTAPQRETALANAKTDQERAARGDPPLMSAARLSNPTVWDRAMERLDRDPEAGARLVDELAKKTRATTVEENALLLQRKIALANEQNRVMGQYLELAKEKSAAAVRGESFDATTLDQLDARSNKLTSDIDQLDKVARQTGTEWGRAGQFRRQLAKEDFSLSSMLQQMQAAAKRELTPEEKVTIGEQQAQITKTQEAEDQATLAFVDAEKPTGAAVVDTPVFKEMAQAQVRSKEAQEAFLKNLAAVRKANQGWGGWLSDLLVKLRVNMVISSPVTLAKIAAASVERIAFTPLEEVAGEALSRLPGLQKIARAAPREGRGWSDQAEKKAFLSSFTDGLKDALKTVMTGKSDLATQYGKEAAAPREWLDYQFSLHDAMKAPAVRAEFTRSFLKRLDAEAAAGRDATSPAALLRLGSQAYQDAQAAKFRQENWLVDAYNKGVNSLRKPGQPVAAQLLGTGLKLLTPVVRVPTNLAFEIATHVFGLGTGSAGAVKAWMNGIENLKPDQADAIMRHLKKGSLGAAAMLMGYFNPQTFGGYYSGKRDDDDVKAGAARVAGTSIPTWLLHNPLLEVLQFGATIRRAKDKVVKGQEEGLGAGVAEGVLGLAEEIPLVRETAEVAKGLSHGSQRGAFFGELAKSLAVPQLVQWLAGKTDEDASGEVTKRKPHGVLEHIETGIPGLRQNVNDEHTEALIQKAQRKLTPHTTPGKRPR